MAEADGTTTDEAATAAPQNGSPNGNGLPPQATTVGGGKNVVMPTHVLGKLKSEARDRGKREALAEMESQAKGAGFASMQDMFSTVAALKQGGAARNGQQGRQSGQSGHDRTVEAAAEQPHREPNDRPNDRGRGGGSKEQRRYEVQLDRERKAREAERRARISESRARKAADARTDALEAEMALREQAIMVGVRDVDYAVTLLQRSIEGKTAEELKGFDEAKFFGELREKQPYLFGEVVRPVNSGTGGRAPATPKPGEVAANAAADAQIDARKMNSKQFDEHMAKRGLSLNIAGV